MALLRWSIRYRIATRVDDEASSIVLGAHLTCRRSPAIGSADVIMLPVRWDVRFGLYYLGVEELFLEQGVEVDHVTLLRWVQTSPHL